MTMTLTDPKSRKLVEDQVKSGRYASPQDVLAAALISLEQQEHADEFEAGELDALIDVGRSQTDLGQWIDAEDVFREIDSLRDQAGGSSQ